MVDPSVRLVALLIALTGCSDNGGGSARTGGTGGADGSTSGPDAHVGGSGGNTPSDSGRGPEECEATPAPAPAATWVNATGNLAGMSSECGNLTLVSATPCSTRVIAGVAKKGLWATTDSGKTWEPLGTGAGSATITNRPSSIVYDPAHPGVFWESGIYNDGGVYRTNDDGATFEQLGSITHDDLVSIDFGDSARKTLLAGGHEQKQTLHRSTDGGQTWTNVGANLPATAHFSSLPLVVDGTTHLVGTCGWGEGDCGIWRTADGGDSWTRVSEIGVQSAPLWASDGTLYWPAGGNGVAASNDAGQTWTQASSQGVTGSPIELPDKRLVVVGGDHLLISSNGAKDWSPIGEPLPFAPSGVTYSALEKTFYIWHWDCGETVLPDAIMSAGFEG